MLGRILIAALAGVGAYLAARRLLEDEQVIERLPEAAREPARQTRALLIEAREQAADVLREIGRERSLAEHQLEAEYLVRSGRAPASTEEGDVESDLAPPSWLRPASR